MAHRCCPPNIFGGEFAAVSFYKFIARYSGERNEKLAQLNFCGIVSKFKILKLIISTNRVDLKRFGKCIASVKRNLD